MSMLHTFLQGGGRVAHLHDKTGRTITIAYTALAYEPNLCTADELFHQLVASAMERVCSSQTLSTQCGQAYAQGQQPQAVERWIHTPLYVPDIITHWCDHFAREVILSTS